ncbi:ribonuclease H-like domain-containing protein [Tanacetum coccineum]
MANERSTANDLGEVTLLRLFAAKAKEDDNDKDEDEDDDPFFVYDTNYGWNLLYEAGDDQLTLISKLDLSSPLYLHPNDSATLTVVSVKLKGTENYQVWSFAMLLALEGKNKTGFIDRSCRRSNIDEVLGRQCDRVNAVVLGWILNSISEELFWGQFFSKRAKHVRDELKETYDKVDVCDF